MFSECVLAERVAEHLERIGKRLVEYLVIKRSSAHARYYRLEGNCVPKVRDKRVLVVRGSLGSGFTTDKLMRAVRTAGGQVLGLGLICNRGDITSEDVHQSFRIEALMSFSQQRWRAGTETCPLCKKGIPLHPKAGLGALSEKKKA